MGSSSDPVSLEQLDALVQSAQSLIQELIASTRSLTEPSPSSTSASSSAPAPAPATAPSSSSSSQPAIADPVALARDSAALVRANVTKLSLLIINEPFSPSAIAPLLGSSLLRPLLALLAAVQACHPDAYTLPFRRDLAYRAQRLFSELASFLAKIPSDGKALTGAQRDGFRAGSGSTSTSTSRSISTLGPGSRSGPGSGPERGSIPATALVWSACDALAALADMGVAGFLAHKISEWKDTLDDIFQELKEWSEQDPSDDDDDDFSNDADSADELDDPAQRMLDDLMAQKAIPADDPDHIRPRLATTLRHLRMTVLLYQTLIKRRIKKLPPLPWPSANNINSNSNINSNNNDNDAARPDIAQQLTRTVALLGKLPDAFGDLAAAFYEMRPPAIDSAMAQCFEDAASASALLAKNWVGAADEFTQWSERFQTEIKKP